MIRSLDYEDLEAYQRIVKRKFYEQLDSLPYQSHRLPKAEREALYDKRRRNAQILDAIIDEKRRRWKDIL